MSEEKKDVSFWDWSTTHKLGKRISIAGFIFYHVLYLVSALVDYFTMDMKLTESFKTMTSELYPFWIVLAIGVGASGLAKSVGSQVAGIFSARRDPKNTPTTPTTGP